MHARMRWQQQSYDPQWTEQFVDRLQIHPIVAQILHQRGCQTVEEVEDFLAPSLDRLYDPYLLKGMECAITRIRQAIEHKEKIIIYGDYDADGVSSTGLMVRLFRLLDVDVDYYIPNRFLEGYGLHKEALSECHQKGARLIITVDTGISAVEEANYARSLGLDLIITDHHEPPAIIPDAYAVINPKQPGCTYPFKKLAGVGVAFKLATALLERVPEELLDMVAVGTIADLVPLVGENRILATWGLQQLNKKKHVGLHVLAKVAGIEEAITSHHVGYVLGPRINACGRLQSATQAAELMITEDGSKANQIAESLQELNQERQNLVRQIVLEATEEIESNLESHHHFIVVAKSGWNVGVVGIVASRLVEAFHRPTIVLGIDEETGLAKGSARSIPGFDLYQALTQVKQHLLNFGGHTMAAGMTLEQSEIQAFHQSLAEYTRERLKPEDRIPLVDVDAELSIRDIDLHFIEQLDRLAPFGVDNPTPRFQVNDATIANLQVIGAYKDTIKLSLQNEKHRLEAIGFRKAELAEQMTPHAQVEVIGELQVNEWNGRKSPQLLIHDMKIPHRQVFDWRGNRMIKRQLESLHKESCILIGSANSYYWKKWVGEKIDWQELDQESVEDKEWLLFSAVAYVDPPERLDQFSKSLTYLSHVERFYFLYGDQSFEQALLPAPTRDHFKLLYQTILSQPSFPFEHRIMQSLEKRTGLSIKLIRLIFQVFEELGFIERKAGLFHVVSEPPKRSLHDSSIYLQHLNREKVGERLIYSSYQELCKYLFSLLQEEFLYGFQDKDSRDSRLSYTRRSI
ncbi:single-stranded-DNA-specific exonuclease RecJ [Seinonella peptonophila]|uniref:single-stranded-DNA-specific exonuclease RecJ n=1 Tax=Seinonella peptonophila TaxID=112248 RepID=UPI00111479E1|nr:single-stranded-DNA-specific exonuclease RecJ [Seinonella peptonophila]